MHNTRSTLPVVLAMPSHSFSLACAYARGRAATARLMPDPPLIRPRLALHPAGRRRRCWLTRGRAIVLTALISTIPVESGHADTPIPAPAGTTEVAHRPAPPAEIMALLGRRCGACHAGHPRMMAAAPRGLDFGQAEVVSRHDYDIYQQAGVRRTMPLGNITHMTEDERALLVRWYQARIRDKATP